MDEATHCKGVNSFQRERFIANEVEGFNNRTTIHNGVYAELYGVTPLKRHFDLIQSEVDFRKRENNRVFQKNGPLLHQR